MKPKHHWTLHFPACLQRGVSSQDAGPWKGSTRNSENTGHRIAICKPMMQAWCQLSPWSISTIWPATPNFITTSHLVEARALPKRLETTLKGMNVFLPGLLCSNTCVLESGTTCKASDAFLEKSPGANTCFWRCGQVKISECGKFEPARAEGPANASSNLQLHSPIELRTPKNRRKAMPQSRRRSTPHTRRTRAAHAHQAFRHKLPSAYFPSRHTHARTCFATFRNSEVSLLNFLW